MLTCQSSAAPGCLLKIQDTSAQAEAMIDAAEALTKGRQQEQAGNLPEAEKWYRYALELRPADVLTLRDIGRLCLTSGRFAEAAALFRQALQVNPDAFELQNDLGIAQGVRACSMPQRPASEKQFAYNRLSLRRTTTWPWFSCVVSSRWKPPHRRGGPSS